MAVTNTEVWKADAIEIESATRSNRQFKVYGKRSEASFSINTSMRAKFIRLLILLFTELDFYYRIAFNPQIWERRGNNCED